MAHQDNLANQVPIVIQCQCGWKGKSDKLVRYSIGMPDLACPSCQAIFKPWPAPQSTATPGQGAASIEPLVQLPAKLAGEAGG